MGGEEHRKGQEASSAASPSPSLDVKMAEEPPLSPSAQKEGADQEGKENGESSPLSNGVQINEGDISKLLNELSKGEQMNRTRETHQEAKKRKMSSCCVGIDLGAQNTVIASSILSSPFSVTVDVNALANRSTPSTEAFDGKLR